MEVEFIQQNWLLFLALVVIIALIVLDPIRGRASGVKSITAVELPALVNHEAAVVVDVSETNDFKNGHIPNALNVPLSRFQDDLKKLQKYKDKPIVLACRSGNKAPRAASILSRNEFKRPYTLQGGLAAWQKENLPVEK